jgi:hypothetical protein
MNLENLKRKQMENKHGLNGKEIYFNPLCDNKIKKHNIIGHDTLKRRLYCIEKGIFVIITDNPNNDYLSDEDLKLNYKII